MLEAFQDIVKICDMVCTGFSTKILAIYVFWHSMEDRFQERDLYLCVLIAIKHVESRLLNIDCYRVRQILVAKILTRGSLGKS